LSATDPLIQWVLLGRSWIWDQSLLTVEINTITRVLRQDICMSCNGRRHDYPRSIVTDHYLLDTSRW